MNQVMNRKFDWSWHTALSVGLLPPSAGDVKVVQRDVCVKQIYITYPWVGCNTVSWSFSYIRYFSSRQKKKRTLECTFFRPSTILMWLGEGPELCFCSDSFRSGCWTTGTRQRRPCTPTTSPSGSSGRNWGRRAGTERWALHTSNKSHLLLSTNKIII